MQEISTTESTDQTVSAPASTDAAQRSPMASTVSWLRDLFLSVVIAVVVILFLYQPVRVEGTSMMPTLVNEERIFINKFVYRFGVADIGRGDMVVFWFPKDTSKSYIKRVIGVPGDSVEVREGTVWINGKPLNESYVTAENRDSTSMPLTKLEGDNYFVLGDHRNSSNDSRSWGMVDRKYIYGKAVFVYWPLDRLGVLR